MASVDLNQRVFKYKAKHHLLIFCALRLLVSPIGLLGAYIDHSKLSSKDKKGGLGAFSTDIFGAIILVCYSLLVFNCCLGRFWFKFFCKVHVLGPIILICIEITDIIWPSKVLGIMMDHVREKWPPYKYGVIGAYISFFLGQLITLYLGICMAKLLDEPPRPPPRPSRRREEEGEEDSDSDEKVKKSSNKKEVTEKVDKSGKSGKLEKSKTKEEE
ncbi:hypothetical protein CRE_13730 [Caenorhabditis remanei]|uniref:Uncharacterized protein n=1 Tax=Caenorhabditis remanei TaxID=31234 RepID=E3NEW4_CAERE|nr:hypothetical protein CRE_13730 [Caenorhabditis remanei]